MKKVYIAGPFRGKTPWVIHQNVLRAEALSLEVWRMGAAAFCPHKNTENFQHAAPDDLWLEGDLAWLKVSDALLMTPDWELSSGATCERNKAFEWGIPVFYSLDELRAWLGGVR